MESSQNLAFVIRSFTTLIVICSLAAYNFLGIPLQWIGQAGIVGLAFWIFSKSSSKLFPGATIAIGYILWALTITAVRVVTEDLSDSLPHKATTGYWAYIALRFVAIITCLCAAYVANWLAQREGTRPMLNRLSWIGFAGAIYGLYIYIAQVTGLPEPLRNRMGTGGEEQRVVFTYAFHRAMGSFREPSHFAEWLIVPFFATLIAPRWASLKMVAQAGCLLLTGSLTGIIGITAGFFVASLLMFRHAMSSLRTLLRPIIPVFGALVIASLMIVANKSGSSDIFSTLWGRIEPVFSDRGLGATNRGYVYKYYSAYPVPVLGQGIGHANIKFSNVNHFEAVASFLNLYIANLYSVGVVGLGVLIFFFVFPLWRVQRFAGPKANLPAFAMVAAYVGWLVTFFSHSEELSIHFGLIYGLLVGVSEKDQ